jgi:hypothetical protein
MNPTCARVRSLIPQAVQGELDEASRAVVLDHAEHCPDCRSAREFQARLQRALARDPVSAPPDLYLEGVLAEIHRRMPSLPDRVAGRRRLDRRHFASAAIAALFALWIGGLAAGSGLGRAWPGGPGGRSGLTPALIAAARPMPAPRMVAVAGLGLVSEDSGILRLPPAMLRELGLREEEIERIAQAMQIREAKGRLT